MLHVTNPTPTMAKLLLYLVYSGIGEAEYYLPTGTTHTTTLPSGNNPPPPPFVLVLPESEGMVLGSILILSCHHL